ncbi:homocitrate synthase [Desulfurispirillum indicum]|uniref:Homocitrate synthase n=1 Tax=Desulfurispirillum indicum (strain ATCC BAA-1389 / DSM 22839 / S5) TaxID=653733 RepID=E6W2X2_DESIS|nr:homocitrate synthase [Desulfurispirillum indicum]ADU66797.1 homocitrate synthase [Desulfurispirillum indicum S5]UCZ56116.1 homocitrate synthase [Desulfurispirillum indicum]
MHIHIDDTTLRDGAQTPGVCFSHHEKLAIARKLDALGVEEIEAGIPVMDAQERRTFSAIMELGLKARILAWNRALVSDIEASLAAGARAVEISLPLSDIQIQGKLKKSRAWVLDQLKRVLEYCVKHDLYVSVGGEDASRADMDFLVEYAQVIRNYGGHRLRFCDTVGVLDPFSTYEKICTLIERSGIDVEIHTHNDFGMATANALAAVRAGARYINTTVMGLGERAGNAPLEEVIMALKHVWKQPCPYDTRQLRPLSELVSQAARRTIEPYRPVIGQFMFTHESGIHTDGVLKNPANYEAFTPEEVGLKRRLVVGSHSGSSVLHHKLELLGLTSTPETISRMMPRVKSEALRRKRNLTNRELRHIYQDCSTGSSLCN